jgi:SAM-dependent methyltransferase
MMSPDEIRAIYAHHPVGAEGLLARLSRRQPATGPVSEIELAFDSAGGITDQNHIGGLASTRRLAALCTLSADDVVLDVGCGIGGAARVLAAEFGCAVHGIDIDAGRIRDARTLSDLTRLQARTSFEVAPLEDARGRRAYDVVWTQNASIHMGDPDSVCVLLGSWLAPQGRLALEEVCLLRETEGENEATVLAELCRLWGGRIHPVSDWMKAFDALGNEFAPAEIEFEPPLPHLLSLYESTVDSDFPWPDREVLGLAAGCKLAQAGVLGYFRAVVNRSRGDRRLAGSPSLLAQRST